MPDIEIVGCVTVAVAANRDARGCLFEIYRENWPGAFPAKQWNVCASDRGVVRGVHVHFDYDEYYTLPRGQVTIGLVDIRKHSPTFRRAAQFLWSDCDQFAVVVPAGVAHVVRFEEESILAFGLSEYWRAENDHLGCRWDDPGLGLKWDGVAPRLSERDASAGSLFDMVEQYNRLAAHGA